MPVYIRDEFVDCLRHRVCAVESSDQPVLGKRVSLFFDIPLYHGCLTVAYRPCGYIMPVLITGQYFIGINFVSFDLLKHILTVTGGARPVHES